MFDPTPKTPEQYMNLLEQTLFELDDLVRCAEEEGEDDAEFTKQMPFYRKLRQDLVGLRDSLVSGEHRFGQGKDLPFWDDVRLAPRIPFRPMLDLLNVVYRKGFPEN